MLFRRFLKWSFVGVAVFVLAVGLYVAAANIAYATITPAELPCRNCDPPVTVDGFELYYREAGNAAGPVIVILHGGPGMSSDYFANAFAFLEAGYRVVYYDQRGGGNSQIKPSMDLYTIDQLRDELEALRADVIGTEQMILLGHSFGGGLAQWYAVEYPQHVAAMILISPTEANQSVRDYNWERRVLIPVYLSVARGFPPRDPLRANTWYGDALYAATTESIRNNPATLPADFGYASYAPANNIVRSMYEADFEADLHAFDAPVLLAYGAFDSWATGDWATHRAWTQEPNVQITVFEDSGHWSFFEEPDAFRRVVLEFLSEATL